MHTLGIDTAKKSFDVQLVGGSQQQAGTFDNNHDGFGKLRRWLKKRKVETLHVCMEATGRYWEDLAFFLYEEGHSVSVVNPKLIKRHSETTMQRNKTDRQDAATITDYCLKHKPDLWSPPPLAYRQLRTMVRHLQTLKNDRTRARNRRQSGIVEERVLALLDAQIAFLDQQIEALEQEVVDHIDQHPGLKADKELLVSIPGIADTTAAVFLAEVPDVSRFQQARQLAAYAGLTPGQQRSGTSLHRPGRLVKWGNAHLRSAFFMPALSAHRWNPFVAALRTRLQERGKSKMTIVVASMRKLLHLAYGVLKTRKPFNPNHTAQVGFSS